MKLYYTKGACSLGARITINELGIPCEFISVDLKTKKTEKGEDFTKINKKGAVPTLLRDNNQVLTESSAIQQYLATENDGENLLPPVGDPRHYDVLEWLGFITSDLHKGFSPFFNPKVPNEMRDEVFKPILMKKFGFVDENLEKNKFLTGDNYSVADSYLFVMLLWSTLPFIALDISQFKNLSRYFEELQKRPSIQKALKDEGVEVNAKSA